MKYLAIDPGKVTGWAWRYRGKVEAESISVADLKTILTHASARSCNAAVIEDVYKDAKVGIKSYRTMVETRTEIVRMCEWVGFHIRNVHPMTWKHAMLTVSGYFPPTRTAQKATAIWVAENALGVECHDDDNIGEAACILAWAERTPWEDGP